MDCELCFELNDSFVEKYKTIDPPFGFNGLGEIVYRRTYSRRRPDGTDEDWWQTVKRVVEGTYSLQKEHIEQFQLGWNEDQAQKSAQEMYDLMFNMKFLPPGMPLSVPSAISQAVASGAWEPPSSTRRTSLPP